MTRMPEADRPPSGARKARARAAAAKTETPGAPGLPPMARTLGNAATARLAATLRPHGRPLQRVVKDKKTGKKLAAADPKLKVSAPAAVRLVIAWWATSASAPAIDFTTKTALAKLARDELPNMPAAFVNELTDQEFEELVEGLPRLKGVKPSQSLTDAIAARASKSKSAFAAAVDPASLAVVPVAPLGMTAAAGWETKAGDRDKRDQMEFFRTATGGKLPGFGATTSAAGFVLVNEELVSGQARAYPARGETRAICPGHGGIDDAAMFEVDHQQSASEIRDNLHKFADAASVDNSYCKHIKTAVGARFFQIEPTGPGKPDKVTVTAAALAEYSNDVANLMRICRRCNGALGKSDMDFEEWAKKATFFGPRFHAAHALPKKGGEQVIARAPDGRGWAEVAREWFAKEHLAVLSKQFPIDELVAFARELLTRESQAGVEARHAPDPVERGRQAKRAEALGRESNALIGTAVVPHKYFSGTLTKKRPRSLSPGSDVELEEQVGEVFRRRDEKKEAKRLRKLPPYDVGRGHALAGLPAQPGALAGDDRSAYDNGYRDGLARHRELSDQGTKEAMALDLAKVRWEPVAAAITEPAQKHAFEQAIAERMDAYGRGVADGRAGAYDVTAVRRELLLDYGTGYMVGQSQASK